MVKVSKISNFFSISYTLLLMKIMLLAISSLLLLLSASTTTAAAANTKCDHNKCVFYRPGISNGGMHHRMKRMANGTEGDIRAMPWMVALFTYYVQYSASLNQTYNTFVNCSASLVSRRHVLTAAHCVPVAQMPNSSYTITVHYGSANRYTAAGSIVLQKEAVHRHPNVTSTIAVVTNGTLLGYILNDLAILDLGQDLELDDTVQPICVACLDNSTYPQGPAIIAGWGAINPICITQQQPPPSNHTSIYPDIFNYQTVGVHQCHAPEYESADKICTQADLTHGFGGGDSGGPVLASYNNGKSFLQVGVINSNNCRADQRENGSNKIDKQWFEQITGIKCKNFPEEQ